MHESRRDGSGPGEIRVYCRKDHPIASEFNRCHSGALAPASENIPFATQKRQPKAQTLKEGNRTRTSGGPVNKARDGHGRAPPHKQPRLTK